MNSQSQVDILLNFVLNQGGAKSFNQVVDQMTEKIAGFGQSATQVRPLVKEFVFLKTAIKGATDEAAPAMQTRIKELESQLESLINLRNQITGGAGLGKTYAQTNFFDQLGKSAANATPQINELEKSMAGLGKSAMPEGRSWFGDLDEAGKDLENFTAQYERAKPQIDAYIKSMGFRKTGEHVPRVMREINDLVQESGMTFEDATKQVTGFDENLNKVGGTAQQTGEKVQKSAHNIYALIGGFGSFFLSFAARDFQRIGTFLLSPLQKFIALEQGSGVGAAWANNMRRVEDSFQRIGAVMANTLLPLLEKAADLAEDVADFAEAHPEIVKIGLGAGIGFSALGGILQALASLGMMFSAAVTLGAATVPVAGAGFGSATIMGASLATIGTTIGTAIGMAMGAALLLAFGTWAGKEIGNFMARKAYGEDYEDQSLSDAGTTLFRILKLSGAGLVYLQGALLGLEPQARESAQAILKFGEAINKAGETDLSPEAVNAYMEYDKQRVELEQQYEEQRTEIVRQYGQQRADLEAQYEQQRNSIIAQYTNQASQQYSQYLQQLKALDDNFKQAQIDAYAQYQAQIAQMQADFAARAKQAAQDHQDRLEQLAREHAERVEDLTNARDALGLAQENRDYKQKVDEENKRYAEELARMREEYQRQMAELKRQYQLQEQERQRQYEEQKKQLEESYKEQAAATAEAMVKALEELDEKHKQEQKELEEAEKKKLSELEKGHAKQLKELLDALYDQWLALSVHLPKMKALQEEYYAWCEAQAQHLIDTINELPTPEKIEPPITEKLAVRNRLGGSLETILRGGNITVNQTLRFSGELGAADKRHIQRIAKTAAIDGVLGALAGA